MIIKPKVRDFICTTAHPDGCRKNVELQIEETRRQGSFDGPKKVLVIGSSTGYGLSSRIALAFGAGAATLGVMFERPASGHRTATPGWYNTKAFEAAAADEGLYAKTINGDAFSREVKDQVIEAIRADLGTVDLVVYSLAAPKRTTADGVTYSSVLKTVGEPYTNKSLNLRTNEVYDMTIPPAEPEEVEATVKVMGGEDWLDWIAALSTAGVLAPKAFTAAYSYIGPEVTYPIYYRGTIGQAKEHLYQTALEINRRFGEEGVFACISINKALVTQASSAIPVVPLYLALLYRVMKEKGIHEDGIAQMNRLFRTKLVNGQPTETDKEGRIRLDDWEMREDVQKEAIGRWERVTTENVRELTDLEGYWKDFYHMFGFEFDGVDYERNVDLEAE